MTQKIQIHITCDTHTCDAEQVFWEEVRGDGDYTRTVPKGWSWENDTYPDSRRTPRDEFTHYCPECTPKRMSF